MFIEGYLLIDISTTSVTWLDSRLLINDEIEPVNLICELERQLSWMAYPDVANPYLTSWFIPCRQCASFIARPLPYLSDTSNTLQERYEFYRSCSVDVLR
jgi:hypothetical protein